MTGGVTTSRALGVAFAFALMTRHGSSEDAAAVPPPLAAKYCTACHLAPSPSAMTRRHWTQVFGFMSVWIHEKGLPFDQTEYNGLLHEYLSASPEKFVPIPDELSPPGLLFETLSLGDPPSVDRPVITHLARAKEGDDRAGLLVCDDRAGRVSRLHREAEGWKEEPLFEIPAPSCAVALDYDGDGLDDLAVSSLGVIYPTDQLLGSLSLLRNLGDGRYEENTLLAGCPRISEVDPADFNGDGRADLLVVQFGWRTTGGLLWLEQVSPESFVSHEIARIHGALQAEVLDYDGDGHQDFVVLFSQEHEMLVLFRNQGGGRGFENRILAQAPHPAFGSSGFSAVDLDQDGDVDFLWTNGDMMDEIPLAKPYHGLRWLENRNGELVTRELAKMPGCYRAVACDLDGDGDLDIAASSLNFQWDLHDYPSLIWLENDGDQGFTARRLLSSPANLASLVAGDFDGDGLPDLVVGGMHVPGPLGRVGRLTGLLRLRPGDGDPGTKPR